jgi:tetratricopeptide (TPR) repeat protein
MHNEPSRLSRLLVFLEYDPGNLPLRRDVIHEARSLHHLGRRAEAIDALQAHPEVMADDAEANGVLGLLLYDEGRAQEAREHVDAALAREPTQIEALLTLASMQSDALDLEAARASFDAIVRAEPNCGRAWLGLALLNLRELRFEPARRDATEAAIHLSEHIGTWHVLAWANILFGDLDGAKAALEKALGVDRNFAETHGGLAVVAALQGREPDAQGFMRRALRLHPQSLAAKLAEVVLVRRAGRDAEAKRLLESLLSQPLPGRVRVR